ncbi:hypothetical protein DFH09DRAFT_1424500 [Mycena vulgaris]|nr:hypothetical protein DFH09DRAFT_1424500 [Mycena vulgaris]
MDPESPLVPIRLTPALRCLGTFDVFCEVIGHTHRVDEDVHRNESLVNILLTCKAFTEPALDLLWRELTSLRPLLKLLPSFTEASGVNMLLGPLDAANFFRFDYYAIKVRSLEQTAPEEITMHSSLFMRLAQEHPAILLPRLERLHIATRAQLDSGTLLLLPPSLRSVRFDSDASEDSILHDAPFLAFVSIAAHFAPPAVEHLILTGAFPPKTFHLIPRFSNLKKLEMGGIARLIEYSSFIQALSAISLSTDLTSLILKDVPAPGPNPPGMVSPGLLIHGTPVRCEFRALKEFEIVGGFAFIERLVHHLTTRWLREITLIFTAAPQTPRWRDPLTQWEPLFNLISHEWNSTLERVTIGTGNHHRAGGFGKIFSKFCTIQNLREFRLVGRPSITTSLEDIIRIATGYPMLEILGVGAGNIFHEPVASLPALVHFAKNCPCAWTTRKALQISSRQKKLSIFFMVFAASPFTLFSPKI